MIDDGTFEKLFRNTIEGFLSRAGVEYGKPSAVSQDHSVRVVLDDGVVRGDDVTGPIVKRFEFEDHSLLVIQGYMDESSVAAKAKGNLLLLQLNDGQELLQEMPFMIDVEESTVSCRNGVTKIVIMKSETEKSDELPRLLIHV